MIGQSLITEKMNNNTGKLCVTIAFVVIYIILVAGCAQVEQIPEQVPKELPNPVSDFTQKDKYMIGLRWYQQGNLDIAVKFWRPLAESGDCDAQYSMGLLYYRGAGVRKSYNRAVELWTGAAEQGQAQAQSRSAPFTPVSGFRIRRLTARRGAVKTKTS